MNYKQLFIFVVLFIIAFLFLLNCQSSLYRGSKSPLLTKIYEDQKARNDKARSSGLAEDLTFALDETEKTLKDTVLITQNSETQLSICKKKSNECTGEKNTYRNLFFALAAIIVVYLGFRFLPVVKRFIPVLLLVFSFSFTPPPLNKTDIYDVVGYMSGISDGLLRGIAYAETGHLQNKPLKRTTAISSAGAVGLMQIKPSTAGDVCPKINLYNPSDSVICAALYLKWIEKRYCHHKDSFCLAMSYRHGPTGFRRGANRDYRYWGKVKKFLEV